jgi:hypothetical protein
MIKLDRILCATDLSTESDEALHAPTSSDNGAYRRPNYFNASTPCRAASRQTKPEPGCGGMVGYFEFSYNYGT